MSNRDKNNQKYAHNNLSKFTEIYTKGQEINSWYQFYKESMINQKVVRKSVEQILISTGKSRSHLRPYISRSNFCLDLAGLPQDTPFELYCFFRAFKNIHHEGNLDNFKEHRLHESIESELVYSEMCVSGNRFRYVLLSA